MEKQMQMWSINVFRMYSKYRSLTVLTWTPDGKRKTGKLRQTRLKMMGKDRNHLESSSWKTE
jgi:hypothetical protein